ncbi:MAG: hypothetical protein MUE44_10170 [Oscillatoriaceae cyanobacterium Prado104]|nr:hypothetical protein [Oscillatoriaceae cyanobacterium Prado104]
MTNCKFYGIRQKRLSRYDGLAATKQVNLDLMFEIVGFLEAWKAFAVDSGAIAVRSSTLPCSTATTVKGLNPDGLPN